MRWLAGVLSVVVLAGCAHTVGGTAAPATSALKILPTEDEISSVAGNTLSTFGFKPFVGGVEILPDGFRTDSDAAPIGCAAVTDTAPRIVYEPLPVLEAARQSYFNWDEGVDTSGADAAVVRLSTAAAAKDAFGAFGRQWQQCAGTTVVKHVLGTVIDAEITDVTLQGRGALGDGADPSTAQRPHLAVRACDRCARQCHRGGLPRHHAEGGAAAEPAGRCRAHRQGDAGQERSGAQTLTGV